MRSPDRNLVEGFSYTKSPQTLHKPCSGREVQKSQIAHQSHTILPPTNNRKFFVGDLWRFRVSKRPLSTNLTHYTKRFLCEIRVSFVGLRLIPTITLVLTSICGNWCVFCVLSV